MWSLSFPVAVEFGHADEVTFLFEGRESGWSWEWWVEVEEECGASKGVWSETEDSFVRRQWSATGQVWVWIRVQRKWEWERELRVKMSVDLQVPTLSDR